MSSSSSHKRSSRSAGHKSSHDSSRAKKSQRTSSSSSSSSHTAAPTGAIGRFASHSKRAMTDEINTLDWQFTGAYAAAYTADTQPAQVLNIDTGTATLQALNLAQQGTGISQRLNNKIAMKSLRLRLSLKTSGNNQPAKAVGRLMVLYDRNVNGTYPAVNNILSESLQNNTIAAGIYSSNLNPNFFDRFAVLMDKFITIPPQEGVIANTQDTGPTVMEAFQVDEFIKLKNLESQFSATSSPMTIANIQTGALYILSYGDTAAANVGWCWQGSARLRFRSV